MRTVFATLVCSLLISLAPSSVKAQAPLHESGTVTMSNSNIPELNGATFSADVITIGSDKYFYISGVLFHSSTGCSPWVIPFTHYYVEMVCPPYYAFMCFDVS